MALSLTAEQKSIFEIFSGKNQYIIPPYQRPYSWTESQCQELFEDLKRVFIENPKEGYFLGNIVIAKSIDEKNRLEVIDGQQRLTTLTLLMKVLLMFDTLNEDLKNATIIKGARSGDIERPRLKTNVFIEKDAKYLEEVLVLENLNAITISRKDNQFKKNIIFFYNKILEFTNENSENIQKFTDFFMNDVFLLPIQTEDSSPERAREKALKIFETINNRGLSLSDSDIFKAKLYSMALNEKKHDDFIKKWKELDEECQNIKYTINDIFRFYTQVIRGKENIKTTEVGLREFFTQKEYSPFNKYSYDKILEDLFFLIENIKFYKDVCKNPSKYNELSKWFQLIEEYTNQYPLNTLFVYLYTYGTTNTSALIDFSKNLVRYCYYQGSTSKVKFYLFDLIIKVANKNADTFIYYPEKVKESDFEYFGLLKKGFSLLCLYLNDIQTSIYPYYFNKIIHSKDVKNLDNSWNGVDYYDYVDTLGNMLVLDIGSSSDIQLNKKISLFENSVIPEIKTLSHSIHNWTYSNYKERDTELKNRLMTFFTKPNNEN